MTPEKAIEFLNETAKYMSNRDTGGEDKAYWANVYNAQNCHEIANVLGDHIQLLDRLRERLATIRKIKSDFTVQARIDPVWEGIVGQCGHEERFLSELIERA